MLTILLTPSCWFDISSFNHSHEWLFTKYMQEGLLLDDHTRGLSAHLVTYNSELRVFGAVRLDFDFQQGGSIKVGWCQCVLLGVDAVLL